MLNQQPPEPRALTKSGVLDVHSVFYTIQGEGPFTGHRAVFVRLAGCNLQCPWCDTEYTNGRREETVQALADEVLRTIDIAGAKRGRHLVVITGGEPLRQTIGHFVAELVSLGLRVQIESNGVFAPDEILTDFLRDMPDLVTLVCSPKTRKVHEKIHGLASAFKYVLRHDAVHPDDGLPTKALGHKAAPFVARPANMRAMRIYVNPEDSKDPEINAANLAAVKRSCMQYGYIAGVQLHKLLDIE